MEALYVSFRGTAFGPGFSYVTERRAPTCRLMWRSLKIVFPQMARKKHRTFIQP